MQIFKIIQVLVLVIFVLWSLHLIYSVIFYQRNEPAISTPDLATRVASRQRVELPTSAEEADTLNPTDSSNSNEPQDNTTPVSVEDETTVPPEMPTESSATTDNDGGSVSVDSDSLPVEPGETTTLFSSVETVTTPNVEENVDQASAQTTPETVATEFIPDDLPGTTAEPSIESATVNTPESSSEFVTETFTETTPQAPTEPIAESLPETSPETSPVSTPESSTEPATVYVSDLTPETAFEASTEISPESTSEASPEFVTETTSEAEVTESEPASTEKPAPEEESTTSEETTSIETFLVTSTLVPESLNNSNEESGNIPTTTETPEVSTSFTTTKPATTPKPATAAPETKGNPYSFRVQSSLDQWYRFRSNWSPPPATVQSQYPQFDIDNYRNVYESWRKLHFLTQDYTRNKIRRKMNQQELIKALQSYNQSLVGEIMQLSQWIEEANKNHRDEARAWNEMTRLVKANQLATEFLKYLTRLQEYDALA